MLIFAVTNVLPSLLTISLSDIAAGTAVGDFTVYDLTKAAFQGWLVSMRSTSNFMQSYKSILMLFTLPRLWMNKLRSLAKEGRRRPQLYDGSRAY